MDEIAELLNKLKLVQSSKTEESVSTSIIKEDLTVEGVAKAIVEEKCKNIIVMTGAGISVAAGIPDFRTPGTGLYSNLQKYNLPDPQAVFEINFFRNNPRPFFELSRELFPTLFKPTPVHSFLKLLNDKGVLLRVYTQNIDTLERIAELPDDKIIEAHGSFGTAHCIKCKEEYSMQYVKDIIFSDQLIPKCTKCDHFIKPDIVFFGENLPERFFKCMIEDFPKCDLLIVIGTSLVVHPFASLINKVSKTTPRLLINREKVGHATFYSDGFLWDKQNNYRDVAFLDDCQDAIWKFSELLGWRNDLQKLIDEANESFLKRKQESTKPTTNETKIETTTNETKSETKDETKN
eukprot:TRINITY_DN1019_c0_g2_i1.p1 TRINITY_DN1019_c0_g2~~TRINITY_DN1019_c0_g2_i1.p1  ORF type:complete len:349 (+),score=170.68 TRINITY_DN1019_c0_g2_i1:63-1109(+)